MNAIDPTAHIGYANIASVFVGVFLPILVGLVSRQSWSGAAKAWTLALFSGISGFLTEFITSGSDFYWQQALLAAIVTFVTAGAAYHNLWKPTGVAARAQSAFTKAA
jgi:L-lactate permease